MKKYFLIETSKLEEVVSLETKTCSLAPNSGEEVSSRASQLFSGWRWFGFCNCIFLRL